MSLAGLGVEGIPSQMEEAQQRNGWRLVLVLVSKEVVPCCP